MPLSMRVLAGLLVASLIAAAPAEAGSFNPNDPGSSGRPGGWVDDQWNFLPGAGVDAPRAWDNLIAKGRPGGIGVKVAVLDTGLAYEDRGPYRRSPDISRFRVARGRDFCAHAGSVGDPCAGVDDHPDDPNGHGTHVASTIAESTYNALGETGLAYGVTIIPVKVLDRDGLGDQESIAAGIDYAVARGAQVINLSFEFGSTVTAANEIPLIGAAVKRARAKSVVIAAAAGNGGRSTVSYPARLPGVISVGATTDHACLAKYSNTGPGLDLVAPGGGDDAARTDPGCQPGSTGRPILQVTYAGDKHSFGLPTDYDGTSMATPHVSAIAALIIASGVLGPKPSPQALEQRLKATARDLGPPGPDELYGAGIVDAGAATAP
jgi:serine protease